MKIECLNLISARENEALRLVHKKVSLGGMDGPFKDPPFFNMRISPIGLIPKKDKSFCLIQHLSYPLGSSVNDFIDPSLSKVQYASFDEAVAMVRQLGQGALLGKTDIKSAFRLLPVSPTDFDLLGIKLANYHFFDKCLPMGYSISCALFEKFLTFLQWVLLQRSNSAHVMNYLDDILFRDHKASNECQDLISTFRDMNQELGVPLVLDKCEGPTQISTFLGLVIDTVKIEIRIPLAKIYELNGKLIHVLGKHKVTLMFVQSLVRPFKFSCMGNSKFEAEFMQRCLRLLKQVTLFE